MAKLQNTFEFVGNLKFMQEAVKETTFDSGWTKRELKAMIKENEANGMFITLEGGYYKSKGKPEKVYTYTKKLHGEDGNKLEVDWEDRNQSSIVHSVADFSKKIIDLTVNDEEKEKYQELRKKIWKIESNENPTKEEKDELKILYSKVKEVAPYRYEFLHPLDALDLLEKIKDKLDGKKLKIKGEVKPSYWNGEFRYNYEISTIEVASEDEKNKLQLDLDLYFGKEVINESLFKTNKILTYDTYIISYDSQTKKDQFFPYPTVLDASKYDLENSKHQAHINVVNKFFTVKDKKKVYQLPYTCKLINGSEIVEFNESMLTDAQRDIFESGLATLEELKPRGNSFGDSVTQVRVVIPKVKNLGEGLDFSRGAKETLIKIEELKYKVKEENEKSKNNVEKLVDESEVFEFNEDDLPF